MQDPTGLSSERERGRLRNVWRPEIQEGEMYHQINFVSLKAAEVNSEL